MFNWFRKPEPQPDLNSQLVVALIDMVKELQLSQNRLIEKVADIATANNTVAQGFVDIWKPRERPQASTSLEERMLAKEDPEVTWEPISPDIFAQLDNDIPIPKEWLNS